MSTSNTQSKQVPILVPTGQEDTFKLPEKMKIPVLSVNDIVLYPYSISPMVLENDLFIQNLDNVILENRLLGLFPEVNEKSLSQLHEINDKLDLSTVKIRDVTTTRHGILARIIKVLKFPDGSIRILLRGLSRIEISKKEIATTQLYAHVKQIKQAKESQLFCKSMARIIDEQIQKIIKLSPNFPEDAKIAFLNSENEERLVDLVADSMSFTWIEKVAVMVCHSFAQRLNIIHLLLNNELSVLQLSYEIQSKVQNAISKEQKELYLREQLEVIHRELGENSSNPDIAEFKKRVEQTYLPENQRKVVEKEIERLTMINPNASDYHIYYDYIDWMLTLPWNRFTEDQLDVIKAAQTLDHDHYGLKDVKDRILEFLAVLQLNKKKKAPILCFIGPPGVGKTSLGQSIARAMNRKFVRISLGGVNDESEIRGHRRTYIGSLPGRIIQGLKKANSSNPVFMLDEIDKLDHNFRGDPASALLEVLDPEQNHAFNDHYLEVDYDLSSIFFIATANVAHTIPSALLDRMEIIQLSGYTSLEKLQIAKQFLIQRQLEENGLTPQQLVFDDSAINEIILHYTSEAGVRSLERVLASVARKFARKMTEGKIKKKQTIITAKEIAHYLGAPSFMTDEAEKQPQVGVVTGLAWTAVGGVILPIEATLMPGKGELKLTGSLGNVMKESALTAFSFLKSNMEKYQIDPEIFSNHDFHIHVPDGATPKDGPSAGISLTTALLSAITNRPVSPKIAMTGEITLRGRVTPIGGVKEKLMAALRVGIKQVILPEQNRKDLEEVPEEIKGQIKIHYIHDVQQAFNIILLKKGKKTKSPVK